MNAGSTIFSQLIAFLPDREFRRIVALYGGDHRMRGFSCWDQFLCMAFAQLTFRESLRDIETCLRSSPGRLYHMGICGRVSRSTLADANERHTWRIFADFAQILIGRARLLYAGDPFGVELQHSVYALDSSTIDLCLAMFPWARFGHAIMADGEPTGTGIETSMDVEFSVAVKKHSKVTGPRLETFDYLISVGAQPEFVSSLDHGLQAATTDMAHWLIDDYGLEPWAAHQLIGAVGKYDVVTVGGSMALKIPEKYLVVHN